MPMQATHDSRMVDQLSHMFFGKYKGIVVDNKDPDKLGRLRLQVPSVLGDSDEAVTDWAWPCVPYGGFRDQGWFFVPEENARVWVEFEEGNLDQPIWVGTYWSKPGDSTEIPTEAQQMPESDDGPQPVRRVLKTSSGHVIEFSDEKQKESVIIRHAGGATITLDENGNAIIANSEGAHIYLNADEEEATLVDQNGNNIRLGDSAVTLTNKDGTSVDLNGGSVQVIAKNVHVRSETVSLGEGAMEPAILGRTFAAMFDAHVHPTALGPSGPPIPVPMPLSAPTNPAISKHVKVL